ncbi:MAG: hypothetical protein LBD90_04475, partial [Bifidobacteriaceae bacterium]|nr:hypothetical protein [Bifidobacteriaceae bacterium]
EPYPFSGYHREEGSYAKVGAGESMQETMLIPALPGDYIFKTSILHWAAETGADSEGVIFTAELTFD